jgi:hypothetical protein
MWPAAARNARKVGRKAERRGRRGSRGTQRRSMVSRKGARMREHRAVVRPSCLSTDGHRLAQMTRQGARRAHRHSPRLFFAPLTSESCAGRNDSSLRRPFSAPINVLATNPGRCPELRLSGAVGAAALRKPALIHQSVPICGHLWIDRLRLRLRCSVSLCSLCVPAFAPSRACDHQPQMATPEALTPRWPAAPGPPAATADCAGSP